MSISRRELLYYAGVAASVRALAACGPKSRTHPVTAEVPAAFDACRDPGSRTLRVLTWNVFMMPRWVHESPRNEQRAAAVAEALVAELFDIVCLEKAFDASSRTVIARRVGDVYPYRYGPANDAPGVKINSGLWVLSRHPLIDYQAIEFDACSSIECFSRKGAVLVSGRCGRAPFRLIATHLQGEEGNSFTEKSTHVRQAQMVEIRDRLLVPNLEPGVPFILCGDFGTPRFEVGGERETLAYEKMVATFGADNGTEARITLDETPGGNALAGPGSGRSNELDYVLLRPNGAAVSVTRTRHVFRRGGWDEPSKGRTDLSYRYAVSAELTFA